MLPKVKKANRKRYNFATTYSFENKLDEEVEVEVEANVNRFVAGNLYGPPENCYPDEGGDCDDYQITFNGKVIDDAQFGALGGNIKDLIEHIEVEFSDAERDSRDDYDDSY
jgi:hypothetical protein